LVISQTPEKILLWSEEFGDYQNGVLSPDTWNFDIGDGSSAGLVGWGNNELQYYTSNAVSIDGNLVIKATRLDATADLECYYGPAQWQSGKIHTARKIGFKYGLLEIVAKTPTGVGTWPALWLLGDNLLDGVAWPQCGEIDILENTGAHPFQVQGTIHGPGYFGEEGLTKIIQSKTPLSDSFHTFAIAWDENSIEWFFDGASYNKIRKDEVLASGKSWPFDQEFYLIMNLAIGGWFAGEVDPLLKSAEFTVESIKYYSFNGNGELFLR
jgi:beta-glucanase (GH16 family)